MIGQQRAFGFRDGRKAWAGLVASTTLAVVLAACSSGTGAAGGVGKDVAVKQRGGYSLFALPDNQVATGAPKTVTAAIAAAKQTVDIVVYNLGSPDITAALKTAYGNLKGNAGHVKAPLIRVMTNAQWNGSADSHIPYVQKTMTDLGVNLATGRTDDGIIQFNWSPNNFNVTHQKTVLVDGREPDGTPYPSADRLPSTAQALVLTANLQAYGYAGKYPCEEPCEFSGGGVGTRDFGVKVTEQSDVFTIQAVFDSDFGGPTPTTTNVPDLIKPGDTSGTLVWSNGTTGLRAPFSPGAGSYPVSKDAAGTQYRGFLPYPAYAYYRDAAQNGFDPGANAGNSRAVHLDIVNNAKKSLLIYNEEYADNAVADAIHAAAKRGVDVKIVMTYSDSYAWVQNWNKLVSDTGAEIHLLPNLSSGIQNTTAGGPCPIPAPSGDAYCGYMYVHAKSILADAGEPGQALFVGSENISTPSLDFNRELGLYLKGTSLSTENVKVVQDTFNNDFALTGAAAQWQATERGTTARCQVVVVDTANPMTGTRAKTLNSAMNGAGCQSPRGAPTTTAPNATTQDPGGQCPPYGPPLDKVCSQLSAQLPQGPSILSPAPATPTVTIPLT